MTDVIAIYSHVPADMIIAGAIVLVIEAAIAWRIFR